MALTANRFDEIKTFTTALHGKKVSEIKLDDIGKMAIMLAELAAEIERIRAVPQVRGGRDHIKPLILGADGRPTQGPPLLQQFAAERREQFALDRAEALTGDSPDPAKWRVFALRWGLSPPPGGWENTGLILLTMHRIRIELDTIPLLQRHMSAVILKQAGQALPPGYRIEDGQLICPPANP